jgi:hypothetical protein
MMELKYRIQVNSSKGKIMEIIDKIIGELKQQSDIAYVNYVNQMRKNECLGWEAKVKCGEFGRVELDAHNRASSEFGKHQAFNEAIRMLHQYRDCGNDL